MYGRETEQIFIKNSVGGATPRHLPGETAQSMYVRQCWADLESVKKPM